MNKRTGATLLELMIALFIGFILLSAAISAYLISVRYALKQQDEADIFERFGAIEMQFRATVPLAIFRPHCGDVILPKFNEAVLGVGVSRAVVDRLMFPVMVHSAGHILNDFFSEKSSVVASNQFSPVLDKSISGLVLGSDVLSITHLEQISFKELGNYEVHSQDSFAGKKELTLMITDCRQIMIIRMSKNSVDNYVMSSTDRDRVNQLFLNRSQLIGYNIVSQLFYLKQENNQISFIQDFLDGTNFFRVPNMLLLRVWMYDETDQNWQRANNTINWHKVSALAVQIVLQSPHSAPQRRVTLTAPMLLGHVFGESISIDSARLTNLNTVFMFKLYNY